MNYIANPVFSDMEKRFLNFILQNDFAEKSVVIEQLNKMRETEISRDITPYFWMIQFRPNGVNPGQGPMRPYICIQVLHQNGIAPTEFTLYERNGHIFELEIYNADSSAMDLDRIMQGELLIER